MSLRSLLRSVVKWIRPPRRVEPDLRIAPEQLRAALSEMLADPETRRLVLRDFVGTIFPIAGGQSCTLAKFTQGATGDDGTFGKASGCGPRVYTFESDAVGNIPLSVKGFTGQTADLQQWKKSDETVLTVVDKDGKLGVRTASPIADTNLPVQISTGGAGSVTYFGANKNGAYGALFGFENGGSLGTGGIVRVVPTGDPLMFFVNNTTEAMRITSGANVGIATGTPKHRLDVNGNAWIGATSASALPDANVSNRFLIVGDSTNTGLLGEIFAVGNTPSSNANVGLFAFANYNITGDEKRIAAIIGATDGANNSGNFQFWTWNAGTGSEKVRIDKNGNVGIGLTNPSEKLRVAGKVYVEQRLGFVAAGATDGAAELYREESSKNIILRSFAYKPMTNEFPATLLALLAPSLVEINAVDRESTISLSRVTNDEKFSEFLDLYNNYYTSEKQYGIRIQRRSPDPAEPSRPQAQFHDFVFDQQERVGQQTPTKFPLMILKASRSVGIGIEEKLSQLTVKGRASFQATGTVTVAANSNTVTGDAGPPATIFKQEVGLGDRIAINGATPETRIVVGIASDSSLTVDSNFNSAHTNKAMTVMKSLFRADDSSGNIKVLVSDQGNVGIGTEKPANILTVVQSSATDPIADAWTTYSSRRWKMNVRPLEGALEKVERLRGVLYDRKGDGKPQMGLIGEEVGEVVPEVVTFDQNGKDARSVDYARLTALLIEAIKEQQQQILELRGQLDPTKTCMETPDAKAKRDISPGPPLINPSSGN